jgi:hypothetical protein
MFQTIVQTKLPANRLCLVYEFDTPARGEATSSVHNECAKRAAEETGLADPSSVRAKAAVLPNASLALVHHQPFDPVFHVSNGGPAVRFEFFYDLKEAKMIVRIVTSLGDTPEMIVDGVTASRIAFHTIELLEGKEIMKTIFPTHPPLTYGMRQRLNFIKEIGGTQLRIFFANIIFVLGNVFSLLLDRKSNEEDVIHVNGPLSLLRFYQSEKACEPAAYQIFRPGYNAFKDFLGRVDEWKKSNGLRGYFYLINFSPLVAPGTTNNINDIFSLQARYKGAFIPPGSGPPPPVWNIENPRMSRQVFINNYGRHKHSFQAKPVAFVWDWLEMAAPLHGCGCIEINDTFLCWRRGLPGSLLDQKMFADNKLGEPVAETTQQTQWFKTMGPWDPAPRGKTE